MAAASCLKIRIGGIIQHCHRRRWSRHLDGVVGTQILHAAIAHGLLLEDVGMGARLSPQLLFEAAEASTSRDQAADDHVLLETAQPVTLALNRRLSQHPGGLLEGGSRDEAVGVERGLGDTQQHRCELGGCATGDCHGAIDLLHLTQLD